jgi:hypothetical protein
MALGTGQSARCGSGSVQVLARNVTVDHRLAMWACKLTRAPLAARLDLAHYVLGLPRFSTTVVSFAWHHPGD